MYERNNSMYIPNGDNVFTLTERDVGTELCGWDLAAVPGFKDRLDDNVNVLQEILNMHALAMTHMDAIAFSMAETQSIISEKMKDAIVNVATIRATGHYANGEKVDAPWVEWAWNETMTIITP